MLFVMFETFSQLHFLNYLVPITSKNVVEMKSANCPDHVLEKIFDSDKIPVLSQLFKFDFS